MINTKTPAQLRAQAALTTTRQQPKVMSEAERQVRADTKRYWTKKLGDCSAIFDLCREYGVSPLVAAQFNERGMSPEAVRKELEQMKAVEQWGVALCAAQAMH